MTPNKVQTVDHPMGFRFARWSCDRLTEDVVFGKKKIIFSDDAHFDLGGYVNKQNCDTWGTKNLRTYIEKSTPLYDLPFGADFGAEV